MTQRDGQRPFGLGPVTRRRFLHGVTATALAPAVLATGRSWAAEELNILVWCDHADRKLVEPFEEAHKVRVNVKTYEGTGTALGILEQSRPGDWDVVVIDAQDVPMVARTGILEQLSDGDVPWDDIFPQLRSAPYTYVDGKLYAVPEKFGYYGVAYNKNKVDPADMRSAQVMWNEKYKGRIGVYDYYFPCIQLIGISMGLAPSQITLDNLPQIRERLLGMKKLVRVIGDIVSVQNALVSGDVDLVVNGAEFTVSNLMPDNPRLDWVIFNEGGLLWNQGLAILADSKKKELAQAFVDHAISPSGQGLLATSDCFWAMPANKNAVLSDAEKAILRWDEQGDFLARSYPSTIGEPALDAAMLDLWGEFIQA